MKDNQLHDLFANVSDSYLHTIADDVNDYEFYDDYELKFGNRDIFIMVIEHYISCNNIDLYWFCQKWGIK